MTSFTKRPECSCVYVFASVTAKAGCSELDFLSHRSVVAGQTVESFMRSIEVKMRTFVVIKVPLTPVLSVVALLAKRT